jgi:hypothetical protein
MHRGDEHHSANGGDGGAAAAAGIGHNRPSEAGRPLQWQTPHCARAASSEEDGKTPSETDLDLVETAFVEGFLRADDPTSFLRLARVPFEGKAADGAQLALLRVEIDSVADIGSVTPHLGGGSFRYDPLPARMVSRRKRLRLVYFDGQSLRMLGLAEAVSLGAS